jgi:hypothetical protein
MANLEHGQGTLHLNDGGQSWAVTYRIQTHPGVTGTLGLQGSAAVVSLQHHVSDPNNFFLLNLSDGRWVHLHIKDIRRDECDIAEGAYIVPPPQWAANGASW